MQQKRLMIVSNRLPVNIREEAEKGFTFQPSSGGLITAMNSYLQGGSSDYTEIYWAGVPGCGKQQWEEAVAYMPPSKYNFLPVIVPNGDYEKYYNGFSNSVLWPLCHYFPSFVDYSIDHFDEYLKVNAIFCQTLCKHLRPGDTIWIHDYHLLPLAEMIRQRIPDITIGFFLHIPFPSFELFRLMPKRWQEQILTGMLGADLVGFHTIDYATHFLQCVQMVLGVDHDRHILRYNNRLIKTDVFPISIDYNRFHDAYHQPGVRNLREILKEKMPKQKIIFSVDRLDYTKGVQNRLRAYELFLKDNPEYRNKVVFIMVIVPSRDTIVKYSERKSMIDELVSRINGETGNIHWQPVIYRYCHLEFDEMLSLYTACDLALITPLRDGMNLVSKEFVASRQDKKGVLILSEMAGAARELTDAININPNDIMEMSKKIKEGLELPEAEQQTRMENMQRRIAHYNVQTWGEDFMTELENIRQRQQSFQIFFLDEHSRKNMLDSYRNSARRLLLLDYDGSLVPFASHPDDAIPGNHLITLLTQLSAIPENDVLIVSGRSSQWLEQHFGHLPIGLIAEHGARSRWKNASWKTEVQTHSEWKETVHQMMDMYVRRCPGSFIEEKDFSIVWHYRNCNHEQGKLRALELMGELHEGLHNRHLEILQGNKILEVRNSGIDKGTAVRKVLQRENYDFIFAVGDDKTDEDMFRMLLNRKNCYSIKVGADASFARFNLHTPQMVISLMENMNFLTTVQMERHD